MHGFSGGIIILIIHCLFHSITESQKDKDFSNWKTFGWLLPWVLIFGSLLVWSTTTCFFFFLLFFLIIVCWEDEAVLPSNATKWVTVLVNVLKSHSHNAIFDGNPHKSACSSRWIAINDWVWPVIKEIHCGIPPFYTSMR